MKRSRQAQAWIGLFCLILASVCEFGVTLGTSPESGVAPKVLSKAIIGARLAAAPMTFEQNQGQFDSRVKFLSRAPGYCLFLTDNEAVMRLTRPGNSSAVLRLKLLGANMHPALSGEDRQVTVSNYFIGSDQARWRAGVPNFKRVRYGSVYPGIDLVLYGNSRRTLEYDLVVKPSAKPEAIGMQFPGARKITVDHEGNLIIGLDGGEIVQPQPEVYQVFGDHRHAIGGNYVLRRDRVGFQVNKYDRSQPLVIDPKLEFLTYLGGSGIDHLNAIALDGDNNIYVTGQTSSTDFPVTAGVFQPSINSTHANAFVAKMNSNATTLLYATYLGGSASDSGHAIAVDSGKNAYVGGQTSSQDFPVTVGAFQTTAGSTNFNGFVTKVDPTGTALVYSTYLAGAGDDRILGIALDTSNNAYLAGAATSNNFPTTAGAFQTAQAGAGDASITELNSSGSALVYSTLLGGSNTDSVAAIALDTSNNAYLVGQTSSTDFPVTAGVLQNKLKSSTGTNVFVTKLNSNGTGLVYSTYLGGSGLDVGNALSFDQPSQDLYVTGNTSSSDFPTTAGAFQTAIQGGPNKTSGFIAKINSDATSLIYSTILGGSGATDQANAIAHDSSGIAYVAGSAGSLDFPVTPDAFQKTETTTGMFFTELNSTGTALAYSTFLSGNAADVANGIVLDSAKNAYIGGTTSSHDLPTTPGVLQPASGGVGDGFVVEFGAPTTSTATPSATATATRTATATSTVTATGTAAPTATATATATSSSTMTATPSPTATPPVPPQVIPPVLSFGTSTIVGKSSKPKALKIKNAAKKKGPPLTIQMETVSSGAFAVKSQCRKTLKPGKTCKVTVSFSPTDTTPQAGTLMIFDNAPGSPHTIPLSGTGKAPPTH